MIIVYKQAKQGLLALTPYQKGNSDLGHANPLVIYQYNSGGGGGGGVGEEEVLPGDLIPYHFTY